MVHLDLAQPVGGAPGHAVVPTPEQVPVRPPGGAAAVEVLFEVAGAGVEVGRDPGRGAVGAVLDLLSALLLAVVLLRHVNPAQGSLEAAGVAVRVSGQVGQDVADAPSRQAARRPGVVVSERGETVRQPPLRLSAQLGRPLQVTLQIGHLNILARPGPVRPGRGSPR